jgi:hypothetical protein
MSDLDHRVVRQSSDGRCHRDPDAETSAIAVHRAAKIEILAATRRNDAIPQRAAWLATA